MALSGARDIMDKLLSVVIVNYNYGRFIDAAIRSVLEQDIPEVELIVVDGGSTDESVEIIKRYEQKLAWWCSEKDKGQADAFNKGFSHAKGKYLTWVNADDMLVSGCLSKVINTMKSHPCCEWFTANFYRIDRWGRKMESFWGPHYYPSVLQRRNSPIISYGPSTFFSKRLFDSVGGMNIQCHYTMDTDLWIRFIVAGVKQRRINCFCWAFRMHEESKTAEFESHELNAENHNKLLSEQSEDYARSSYLPSKGIQILIWCWRILDFSLARLMCLKIRDRYLRFGGLA